MQNLRKNSFEIKWNLNWSESARITSPTVEAEWVLNCKLPFLKESEMPKYSLFKLFSFVFYHCYFLCIFYLWFRRYRRHVVYNDVTHNSVTIYLTLRNVTEKRYVKSPVHFFRWNIFHSLSYEQNFLTNRIAGKLMNIKKIIYLCNISIFACYIALYDKRKIGCHTLNDHGNLTIDHGIIMDKS